MLRSTRKKQDRLHKGIGYERSKQSEKNQQSKAIAKYLSGTATVALSEGNGSQRSTATTHNGGERRNQHNERDGHSHSRQRIGSDARYVSDVNTVYNAVKQIDKLCCHRRQRHLENQRQHTLRAQAFFVLISHDWQSLLLFS